MHGDNAVPAAGRQRLLVGVGQFGRRGGGGGGVALVDVVGDLVHTVAQIAAVEQDVQRNNAYPPPVAQVGRQARRRIGHNYDGHDQRRGFSCGTPASASALSISSATAWWASKFQWMPSGFPRPLMICSDTAAFRSTSGTSWRCAQSVIAAAVPGRPWCALP